MALWRLECPDPEPEQGSHSRSIRLAPVCSSEVLTVPGGAHGGARERGNEGRGPARGATSPPGTAGQVRHWHGILDARRSWEGVSSDAGQGRDWPAQPPHSAHPPGEVAPRAGGRVWVARCSVHCRLGAGPALGSAGRSEEQTTLFFSGLHPALSPAPRPSRLSVLHPLSPQLRQQG